MMLRRQRRRGTVLIEAAFVYPVLFLIILAIIILGLAVFRYQQVAHMAREGSRYAAVHGSLYASENNKTAATADDVYTNAMKPHAAGMDPANISYSVTWNTSNDQQASKVVTDSSGNSKVVTTANTVTVTVTYTWKAPFFGTIPVKSTSVMVMCY